MKMTDNGLYVFPGEFIFVESEKRVEVLQAVNIRDCDKCALGRRGVCLHIACTPVERDGENGVHFVKVGEEVVA